MDKRIGELFQKIEDPRVDRTKKHPLESILYIVLCGTMAGVESWIGYEDYAEAHEEILKEFIDLPHVKVQIDVRPSEGDKRSHK